MKVKQFEPFIGDEEFQATKGCFDSGWVSEGPRADELSKGLCEMMGARHGVFAPNGTLALYLALKAIGIGPGDEVIVPDFTMIASANAVEMAGAKPVFADVRRLDYQVDVEDCRRVLSRNTRAIMPVHIYGSAADMTQVMEFAGEHGLMVIEDAAQALGVSWQGQHCGTFGQVGCFSFYADKTITMGEGGFIVTNDDGIYESLLYMRNQGRLNRGTFVHPMIGYNFRITDMQAAIGLVQLRKFSEIAARKQAILQRYQELLEGVEQVAFRGIDPESNHVPFRATITCDQAHELMDFMSQNDIEPRTFFYPMHRQPCYQHLRYQQEWWRKLDDSNFPNSTYGYEHGVCLPTYASLQEDQVDFVCEKIKEYYHGATK